jgi:hypothetical protein
VRKTRGMGDDWVQTAFGFAPWVLFGGVLLVTWVLTRGREKGKPEPGQTFACTSCGRRAQQGHMTAVEGEGAVSWYCHECARSRPQAHAT